MTWPQDHRKVVTQSIAVLGCSPISLTRRNKLRRSTFHLFMENEMRKSVVLFVLAVAVVLAFIVATPYYYAASPQNKGEQSAPAN